jgi:hypothetical protein
MDPLFKNAVHSGVPVVVASRGVGSITRDAELAVVPYGEDKITIRREIGKQARMISHYFGGAVTQDEAPVQDGRLEINVVARSSAGKPLEWIEVHISQ